VSVSAENVDAEYLDTVLEMTPIESGKDTALTFFGMLLGAH